MLEGLLGFLNPENLAAAGKYLTYALAGLGVLQTGLLVIAPKTKTLWDDKALALLVKVIPGLKWLQGKLKQTDETKK